MRNEVWVSNPTDEKPVDQVPEKEPVEQVPVPPVTPMERKIEPVPTPTPRPTPKAVRQLVPV